MVGFKDAYNFEMQIWEIQAMTSSCNASRREDFVIIQNPTYQDLNLVLD